MIYSILRPYLWIISYGLLSLGISAGNNLYKHWYEANCYDKKEVRKFFGSLSSSITSIILVSGLFYVVVSFYQKLFKNNNELSAANEFILYERAINCINERIDKNVCPLNVCSNEFLFKYSYTALGISLSDRIKQLNESRCNLSTVIKPSVEDKPKLTNPAWNQLLQLLVTAELTSSAKSDEAVRNLYMNSKNIFSQENTDDQKKIVEKAKNIIKKLQDSDARLEKFVVESEIWDKRTGPQYPMFSEITEYDRQRLSENDRYQVAWNVFQKGESLLKWAKTGLTAQSRKSVPIFIKFNGPASNSAGIIIVKQLRDGLRDAGFNTVEKPTDAVLFVNIEDVIRDSGNYYVSQNGWEGICEFWIKTMWLDRSLSLPVIKKFISRKPRRGDRNAAIEAATTGAVDEAIELFVKNSQ